MLTVQSYIESGKLAWQCGCLGDDSHWFPDSLNELCDSLGGESDGEQERSTVKFVREVHPETKEEVFMFE